ncbi:MAG: hypothetical protein AAEJ57_06800, partial [Opitutales bacterium]
MNGIVRTALSLALACGGIFAIEQILYRFSDGYAKARADWLWSVNRETDELSWFKVFPFDQWERFPTHDGKANLAARLNAESEYVQTSLSHTRALRDDLYEELLSAENILPAEMPALVKNGKLGDVYIMVPMTENGVRGTVLRVLPPKDEYQHNELTLEHRDLERQFIPMLRESFACGIVHVGSEVEFLSAVKDLGKKEKNLSRRILAWGKGKSANLLAKAASRNPEAFSVLVLESPAMTMPPSPPNGPFVLFFTDENTSSPVAWNSLEWVDRLRNHNLKPGADRFSGLLTDGRTTARDAANYRLALAYGFMTEVARVSPAVAKPDGDSTNADILSPVHWPTGNAPEGSEPGHLKEKPGHPNADGPTIPVNIPLAEVEPSSPPDESKLFDCKVVRDFKNLNTNPRYRELSNTDL